MKDRHNRLLMCATGVALCFTVFCADDLTATAGGGKEGHDFLSSGVAAVLDPGDLTVEPAAYEEIELDIYEKFTAEEEALKEELVMANVSNTLNVRSQASEKSEKVGFLYKDCGGTILEREDGWTKIRSGNVIGWAKDEYLLFGDEAISMAQDVGNWLIAPDGDTEVVRLRVEPNEEADTICYLAKGEPLDFIEIVNDDWLSVEYDGDIGYINTRFVDVDFHIDAGETIELVRQRRKEEEERKRIANRGAVTADSDELKLLGALIYCEAGNQSYEGMLAVGAVVMNRVKHPAYPNTIYTVIYSSGQFTPAMNGKVGAVYQGHVPDLCMQAAQAAINGETTVGGALYFRRAGRHEGYVLGDHVFW